MGYLQAMLVQCLLFYHLFRKCINIVFMYLFSYSRSKLVRCLLFCHLFTKCKNKFSHLFSVGCMLFVVPSLSSFKCFTLVCMNFLWNLPTSSENSKCKILIFVQRWLFVVSPLCLFKYHNNLIKTLCVLAYVFWHL